MLNLTRFSLMTLVVSAALFFIGCDKNPSTLSQSSTDKGALTVSFVAKLGSPFRTIAKSAKAKITGQDMDTMWQLLTITDSSVSGTVSKIPTGDSRRFEIFVYDSTQTIRYYGSSYTSVYGGQETEVYMTLRTYYGTGDAHVSGTIEDSIIPDPQPFSIYLTSPYNGQIYNIGDSIHLAVSTGDSLGNDSNTTIKSVRFYRDSLLLGQVSKAPFQWNIPKAVAGTYTFHALAINSFSDTAVSQYVTVTVQKVVPNIPPKTSITAPLNGAVFNVGDSVIINATATDSDGIVQHVIFLFDTIYVGTDSIAPYQYKIRNMKVGTHKIQAIAMDDKGASGASAVVSITVKNVAPPNKPPKVSITSPANNSTLYLGDTLRIQATASDSDGTVKLVKFYRDSTTLLASDSTSPYSYTKASPATGVYKLKAIATDNSGATTTSSMVTVTVVATRKP